MDEVCICDIERIFIRGEAEAVWSAEIVSDDTNIACGGIEAIDELGELGFRAETLLVAVDGVSEPD